MVQKDWWYLILWHLGFAVGRDKNPIAFLWGYLLRPTDRGLMLVWIGIGQWSFLIEYRSLPVWAYGHSQQQGAPIVDNLN